MGKDHHPLGKDSLPHPTLCKGASHELTERKVKEGKRGSLTFIIKAAMDNGALTGAKRLWQGTQHPGLDSAPSSITAFLWSGSLSTSVKEDKDTVTVWIITPARKAYFRIKNI